MYACMSMVVFPRTNAYLYLCLYQYVPYLREDRRSYEALNIHKVGASAVAQTVKNLPAMQETWVRSQGQEDPLEKGITTHSSILVWRISGSEESGGLQFMVQVAKSQT